jgi:hypothetical protein
VINKTVAMSASRLKDQDFPLDVRFAGGWRQVHYVSADTVRGVDVVRLLDRDSREIATVYPYSSLAVRVA